MICDFSKVKRKRMNKGVFEYKSAYFVNTQK